MEATDRLKTLTMLVYALQAAGFLLPPVVWIVAVIINYVRKEEVAGTWLESHFRWQIRTFWWGLLWGVIGGAAAGAGGLLRAAGRRDLDYLPRRQGLAQSRGQPADAGLGKRTSSG
jgi:hypothetical protein